MMKMLKTIPSLKYCWSEIVFLKWWLEEYPENIPILKDLIKSKRFEIVGGGWVQNDDALPDFELTLRQMETGLEYINKTLGVSQVNIGWQLDPFGHSSMIPVLWEKMGFEALVVARIDYQYKVKNT
jgi:alpha-mannosidase